MKGFLCLELTRFQSLLLSLQLSNVTLRRMAEMIFSELRFPVEKCVVCVRYD